MKHMNISIKATIGAAVAAAALGGLLASGASSAAIDKDPTTGVALLDRAATPSDVQGLPSRQDELARMSPNTDVTFADARQARTGQYDWKVWAAAGDEDVCVSAVHLRATSVTPYLFVCGTRAQAADGGILSAVQAGPKDIAGLGAGQTLVFGVVPDGAHDAFLLLADGSRVSIDVVDSTIETAATDPAQAVSFTDAAGQQHTFTFGDQE